MPLRFDARSGRVFALFGVENRKGSNEKTLQFLGGKRENQELKGALRLISRRPLAADDPVFAVVAVTFWQRGRVLPPLRTLESWIRL